ncbi:hypothetical protein PT7_0313 [Pusillimonas sp. T7-7]|uniref:hypothetical protein n=1 Tax=Pusillimonas sp. (strain T7-7) TaxID=1007105 RepID=UPI0002084C44|nr:hypothetical protein [Pusillimonas sp. T7-7]AEC18853.1 hypothetical protein PT7_0313 [Pusillimonas sp. T7-7]
MKFSDETVSAFKPFWPREQVGIGDNPKPIDLGKPDGQAAALAEKLQKVPMNFAFGKIVLFIGKWIVRPFIWLPVKFFALAIVKIMAFSQPSKESTNLIRRVQIDEDQRRLRRTL